MSQNLVLTSVTRPSDDELQAAILCFADDAENTDGEAAMNAGLTIVGEACTLLDEGLGENEVIAALGERGLSAACAMPFVAKARDIVQSNRGLELAAVPVNQGNAPKFLVATLVLIFVAAYFVIGIGKVQS